MIYEQHITTKYDEEFEKVRALNWFPWVGKKYDCTGILILGMIPYTNKKNDTDNYQCREESRNIVSRFITNRFEHKPHKAISKMFLEGVKKKHHKPTIEMFWESVAFQNFCQKRGFGYRARCKSKDIPTAQQALSEMLRIIKPKLVIAWTTQVNMLVPGHRACKKIGRWRPQVIKQEQMFEQPIVGIKHPSSFFSKDKWFEFLRTDPASSEPVGAFINYLQEQPVN